VQGALARADDRIYGRAIAVTSTTFLVYDIPPGSTRFVALAAIDQLAGQLGSVRFRLFTRGAGQPWQSQLRSELARGGDPPRPLECPVDQATQIALVVEYGERADERDWANWLEPRFEQPVDAS
jgi:hypothetical protein